MSSRSKDIIFLLGAGASAEADIPVSKTMIDRVEDHLRDRADWKLYRDLYNHVKSAIYFSSGLRGHFHSSVVFNIETLVNTLYELERNDEHPLYPFIAAWNSRFLSLAGPEFCSVKNLRWLILAALKKWMCPENTAKANYYRGFIDLQQDLNYPLHVFSLNYDLCVERLHQDSFRVETGFKDFGSDHPWDWERFEEMDTSNNEPPNILLYKLHGSINWKRNPATKDLFAVEQVESVEEDEMDIIFGRDFKLEAADPYLFFAYQFRRFSLLCRLIVLVGYGFSDLHVNKILTQSIRNDRDRRLLVVQHCDEAEIDTRIEELAVKLELNDQQRKQIIIKAGSAKQFLGKPGLAEELRSTIPAPEEVPF